MVILKQLFQLFHTPAALAVESCSLIIVAINTPTSKRKTRRDKKDGDMKEENRRAGKKIVVTRCHSLRRRVQTYATKLRQIFGRIKC